MNKKSTSAAQVALYGATAVIWVIATVCRFLEGSSYILQLLCTIVWAAGFFLLLRRYREERK